MPVYKRSSQAQAQTNYGRPRPSRVPDLNTPNDRRKKRDGRYRPPAPQKPIPPPKPPGKITPPVRLPKSFGKRLVNTGLNSVRIVSPPGRVLHLVRLYQFNEHRRSVQMNQDKLPGGMQHYAPGYVLNCGSRGPGRSGGLVACNKLNTLHVGCSGCVQIMTTRPSAYTVWEGPLGQYGPNPSFGYWLPISHWVRVSGSSTPSPTWPAPRNIVLPTPNQLPGWSPLITPYAPPSVVRPSPAPLPVKVLPHVNTNPWGLREGSLSWQPSNRGNPQGAPGANDVARPDLLPGPQEPVPGIPPATDAVQPPKPRPPGEKVKEKKAKVRLPYQVVSRLMNTFTETYDAIDAIWFALPRASRSRAWEYYGRSDRGLTYLQKAEWLYRNAKSIDAGKAAKNLLMNQLQDAIIGRASKGAGEYLGGPLNFGGTRIGGLGAGQ